MAQAGDPLRDVLALFDSMVEDYQSQGDKDYFKQIETKQPLLVAVSSCTCWSSRNICASCSSRLVHLAADVVGLAYEAPGHACLPTCLQRQISIRESRLL